MQWIGERDWAARRLARRTGAALALAVCVGIAALSRAAVAEEALDLQSARALEAKLERLAAEATPKTVMVQGVIGLGTGAVIDAEGTVVTNAHVAAGARFAILLHADGTRTLARRKGIDYERDLAVLEPVEPVSGAAHFTVHTERPPEGTWVCALGYPGGPRGDARPTFTVGRVVDGGGSPNPLGFLDYGDAIRVDAPIYSGNSGGPLIDMQGRLIGINGAVDLGAATFGGLTIPAASVMERIRDLDHAMVRLPGGVILDPRRERLLQLLDERLDAIVLDMMKGQLDGKVGPGARLGPIERISGAIRRPDRAALDARDRAIERFAAKAEPRNRDLLVPVREALGAAPPRALELRDAQGGRGLATVLDGYGIVACASSFDPNADELLDASRNRYRVVAWSGKHDLLLLEPAGGKAPAALRMSERATPVGRLIAVLGQDGPQAAGFLSAAARPIPGPGPAPEEAAGGFDMESLIRRAADLAEAFGQVDVAEAARQILGALELRRGFSTGSTPRAYARAISIDAATSPRQAGAPVVDLEGRVVGVLVGTAHFGTSYAVPVDAVAAAFGESGTASRGEAARRREAGSAREQSVPRAEREAPRAPRREAPPPAREGLERF